MKKCMFSLLAVWGVCVGVAEAAETLVIDAQADMSVAVADGTRATLGTNVLMGVGARLLKTGDGTLVLPPARFPQGATAQVGVRAGAIAVAPFNAADVEAPRSDAVLAKAAFWFDAAAEGTVLVTRSNDVDWVDAWLDVRETGDDVNGYTRLRAMPNFLATNVPPSLVEKDGKKAVFFGGTPRSGIFMDWRSPSGAWTKLTTIRHAFFVQGSYNCQGFLLGITQNGNTVLSGGSSYFHVGDSAALLGCTIGRGVGSDNLAVFTGRAFQDGELVDPQTTRFRTGGFHVVEYDCCGLVGQASNFFNDRNYFADNATFDRVSGGGNRIGGDYIAEAIVFTNALTEAERTAVQAWIQKKHLGARRTPFAVTLAEGTTFETDAATASDALADVKGDGTIVATEGVGLLVASPSFSNAASLGFDAGTLGLPYGIPLDLAGGDRVTVAQNGYATPQVSRTADAGAGCVAKAGPGDALVAKLPSSAKSLRVEAGRLALAAPRRSGALPRGGVTAATITNGDFEEGPAGTTEYRADTTIGSWHLLGLSSANNGRDTVIFIRGDGKGSGWAGNASGYGSPLPAPQGQMAMMLKGNASAWTTVTVPADGVYEVSLRCSSRSGYSNLSVDLCIGPDADSLVAFGTLASPGQVPGWTPFSFRTPYLRAGTYQFWFRTQAQNVDRTAAVDDLRMVQVVDDAWSKISIPNGDFERRAGGFDANSKKLANACPGWIVTQNGDALTAFFSTRTMDSCRFFDAGYVRYGSTMLSLLNTGSIAETAAFTPTTSGRVALRARCCNWRNENYTPGTSYLRAKVVVGGVTNDLGTLAMSWRRLKDAYWPNTVELVAGVSTKVIVESSFIVTANDTKSAALVDDLVFVDGDVLASSYGPELISNGGFESGDAGWTYTRFPKSGSMNGNMVWQYVSSVQPNYGYAIYEGANMATIVQEDVTSQAVTVPEAGLYRFRYFAHTRLDNPTGNGHNPVRAFWVDPDEPATTNWIARSLVKSTNFVECAYNVMLPAKRIVVGLKGSYSHLDGVAELKGGDHTTIVDGISLRKVCTAGTGLPEIANDVDVTVAAGAKLRLDYDGVLEVRSLHLGAAGRVGEISAATAPDFIEGPGRLFVKLRGTVILVR